MLLEVDRLAVLDVGVFLDDVDQVDDHLGLRPVEVAAFVDARDVVR